MRRIWTILIDPLLRTDFLVTLTNHDVIGTGYGRGGGGGGREGLYLSLSMGQAD